VAAARQAEVGAADPQPAVALRGGEHVVEERAVGVLESDPLGEGAVRLGEATGERVAQFLELTESEHPRRPGGVDPVGDDYPSQPLGDEPAQLELELADLPAQLGAGQTLIDYDPVEYSPHSRILSRLEGRCSNP
jgi:hypothetical protein